MKKLPNKQENIIQDFQLEILKQINSKNIGKNIMISPLGIFHILSLTANGAANKTMVEMLQLLGHKNKIDLNKVNTTLSSIISSFKTLKMANAIFTKFKPEQVFLSLTEKYNSTVDNLISAEQVNSWCSKATNNTITKIIDDINNALMILINAIYFKGSWEKKFDEKLTNKLVFYNFNKEEKITDFMNITNNFDYFENQNLQAIQIKYNKDNLKAFIILPKTEKDINNYIKNLTKEKYNKIIKGLKNQKVILSLPKFEMNYEEELKDILISMGMKDAFGPADFSVMKKEKDICISKVIHKTYIKVDEQGTVAAAVTAVVMRKAAMVTKIEEKIMTVDRPFLFIIRSDNLPPEHDILFFTKIEAL